MTVLVVVLEYEDDAGGGVEESIVTAVVVGAEDAGVEGASSCQSFQFPCPPFMGWCRARSSGLS